MPMVRTRVALALISIAVIGLELALMRVLAQRFWHHFAYMVISVALLGFGGSGTALTLLRGRIVRKERGWLCFLALTFSLSIPVSIWLGRAVPLDVKFLAWDPVQYVNVGLVELLMLVPFLLAGSVVGIALMDRPDRVGGHYAANLIGSGLGAVVTVGLMYVLRTEDILLVMAGVGYAAGVVVLRWRRVLWSFVGVCVGVGLVLLGWFAPRDMGMSPYKLLSQVRRWPGAEIIYQTEGPLGRVDVVEGPTIHHAPGVGLQWTGEIPPHVLLVVDGDQSSAVYDCRTREDWAFLDHTTWASAYHLGRGGKVLIVGAGGGSDIGLAVFHRSSEIVALEMNGQIIDIMTRVLSGRGGWIYQAQGVEIVNLEARGFFGSTDRRFDIIQVPALDTFGVSGAGLHAAQESYLYTVESLIEMLGCLGESGVICITRWARVPPREGLKIFDTAGAALRAVGLDASRHLAMLRGVSTVTVLVFKRAVSEEEADLLREFCRQRGFDLCYLPSLTRSEANRYHVLDQPYYFDAAGKLLGPGRDEYLDNYVFHVAAASDDKPYFYQFLRLRSVGILWKRLGGLSPAFMEIGYLMMIAALVQSVLLAAVMILLPLAVRVRSIRSVRGRGSVLGYFALIGVGFMLLEMGFLQKLILYLAHPIYSAAVVIGGFLVFGGLGSQMSSYWRAGPRRVISAASFSVVVLGLVYLFCLDGWLAVTRAAPMGLRFIVAGLTISPLAFAMGHMFPAALRSVGSSSSSLVPWAWAVNGFASVSATVAAPLLAMNVGFSRVTAIAVVCYGCAGLIGRFLPAAREGVGKGPLWEGG